MQPLEITKDALTGQRLLGSLRHDSGLFTVVAAWGKIIAGNLNKAFQEARAFAESWLC